jgi:hypothetical protein
MGLITQHRPSRTNSPSCFALKSQQYPSTTSLLLERCLEQGSKDKKGGEHMVVPVISQGGHFPGPSM